MEALCYYKICQKTYAKTIGFPRCCDTIKL